jgi:deoxyadenosine/deoxycytidine kinase
LNLYFEYFERLTQNLHTPDLIIYLHVNSNEVLLQRIRKRGRQEEMGITQEFLDGLGGYYVSFPQVIKNKYGVEVKTFNVTETDIRKKEDREKLLSMVTESLKVNLSH